MPRVWLPKRQDCQKWPSQGIASAPIFQGAALPCEVAAHVEELEQPPHCNTGQVVVLAADAQAPWQDRGLVLDFLPAVAVDSSLRANARDKTSRRRPPEVFSPRLLDGNAVMDSILSGKPIAEYGQQRLRSPEGHRHIGIVVQRLERMAEPEMETACAALSNECHLSDTETYACGPRSAKTFCSPGGVLSDPVSTDDKIEDNPSLEEEAATEAEASVAAGREMGQTCESVVAEFDPFCSCSITGDDALDVQSNATTCTSVFPLEPRPEQPPCNSFNARLAKPDGNDSPRTCGPQPEPQLERPPYINFTGKLSQPGTLERLRDSSVACSTCSSEDSPFLTRPRTPRSKRRRNQFAGWGCPQSEDEDVKRVADLWEALLVRACATLKANIFGSSAGGSAHSDSAQPRTPCKDFF